jgi:NADPH:quinone reductase-like Zn-dependent oxidoreductase
MASAQNTAAWLPGVGKPLEVRPADIPAPGEGELLIEVSEPIPNWPKYSVWEICSVPLY